ncbi:MAG: hypothetical protein LBR79_05950 [Oscillospiraceae bacterium]|nr:hypothetical protein [Oscillospiraceae bacterium]
MNSFFHTVFRRGRYYQLIWATIFKTVTFLFFHPRVGVGKNVSNTTFLNVFCYK